SANSAFLLVLAAALVVAPGGYDSIFGGTPLSAIGRVSLCLLFGAWLVTQFLPLRRAPGWWSHGVMIGLIVIKLGLGLLAIPSGWRGYYRFEDQRARPQAAAFFWRFAPHDFRIDKQIAFDSRNFDLHFLNDVDLFGYPPYSTKRRETEFPLDVKWTGNVRLEQESSIAIGASAAGRLTIVIDGGIRAETETGSLQETARVSAGAHAIRISYLKPANVAPWVYVTLTDARTGAPIPVT